MKRTSIIIWMLAGLLYPALHTVCAVESQPIRYTPKPFSVTGLQDPVRSLNGTWDFNPAPPAGFWKRAENPRISWQQIDVPGEWFMQGFEVKPGTRAAYRKVIDLPSSWKDYRIILKCDALYSDAVVYFNGKEVGRHMGGFTPCEFDLTQHARPGKINSLVIGLISESLADTLASATQYAAHQLGGITRKIELFAVPHTHLASIHVETDLDSQFRDARVNIHYQLTNHTGKAQQNLRVKAALHDMSKPDSQPVELAFSLDQLAPAASFSGMLPMMVFGASTWDPEHPRLYQLTISLFLDGRLLQEVQRKIGIREIEVAGNKLLVNGQPVKLRGWNRHEVDPLRGRSLTMEQWSADVKLLKEANLNYIRTSHYPPAEDFIALCDAAGFFVELEAPLCWIGHGANAHWREADPHNTELYDLIRQQILETVEHYRGHPSVLIWSLANESAWGPLWQKILEEVNLIDPSRPVSFHDQAYGGYNNHGSFNCQIANIHYPGPGGPRVAWKYDRPLLFGEFAHLNTYNRQEIVTDPGVRDAWGRGLESMWEDMYASPGCLGGAIWSGVDDVFYLPSGKAVGYGEWGPIDGWRRTKPEYWHVKKIYSPVKVTTNRLSLPRPGQPVTVPVENRHLFTNLREVRTEWSLGGQQGVTSADVAPGTTGVLRIQTYLPIKDGDLLKLKFWSPQGFVLDQYEIAMGREPQSEIVPAGEKTAPDLVIQGNRVMLQWRDDQWIIHALSGKLEHVTRNFEEILLGGPHLMMLPLASGPCDTEHSLDIEPLNDICHEWNGRITETGTNNEGHYVKVNGSCREADLEMSYHLDSTGIMNIRYTLTSRVDINPRQMGMVFDLPRKFENLAWKRIGQWSVYPENHIGRTSGISKPFPDGEENLFEFGVRPGWAWEADLHSMGSNDFRATRDRLIEATLLDAGGMGLKVVSDGTDAARAWVGKDHMHWLIASFSTAGGDIFFSSHLEKERKPLKTGDKHTGSIRIMLMGD